VNIICLFSGTCRFIYIAKELLCVCYVEFSNYMICFPFHLSTISSPVLIVFPLPFFLISYIHFDFFSFQLDFDVCKFWFSSNFILFVLFVPEYVFLVSGFGCSMAFHFNITTCLVHCYNNVWTHLDSLYFHHSWAHVHEDSSWIQYTEGIRRPNNCWFSDNISSATTLLFMHLSPLRSIILFTI